VVEIRVELRVELRVDKEVNIIDITIYPSEDLY